MVTIQTGLAINSGVPADRTIAQAFRRVMSQFWVQSAVGDVTPGVIALPGLTPLVVTTDGSAMEYHVSAGYAVIGRTNQGVYIVGSIDDTDITGVSVGDGSNDRYDRVYIVQPDPELGDAGVARIAHVEGTPSGTPALPSLPTGALELGRKLVPAGASNTSAGTAISNPAPSQYLNVVAAQVNGLSALLAAKANTSHTHAVADLTNLSTAGDAYKVGGKRWLTQVIGSGTPGGLSVGDVVVEY